MRVSLPSEPQNVSLEGGSLTFSSPASLGGSHILCYEVNIFTFWIQLLIFWYKVHLKPADGLDWGLFQEMSVQHLSCDPLLRPDIFSGLGGSFILRVCAKNRAGRGVCSEEIVSTFSGERYFGFSKCFIGVWLGNISPKLTPLLDGHFDLKYETFWEEFLFIADHADIPKVWIIIVLDLYWIIFLFSRIG